MGSVFGDLLSALRGVGQTSVEVGDFRRRAQIGGDWAFSTEMDRRFVGASFLRVSFEEVGGDPVEDGSDPDRRRCEVCDMGGSYVEHENSWMALPANMYLQGMRHVNLSRSVPSAKADCPDDQKPDKSYEGVRNQQTNQRLEVKAH